MDKALQDQAYDLIIVIVSFNSSGELPNCLDSLGAACGELTWKAVVVDNASSDGSADLIAGSFPEVQLITNEENRGYGRACNQGSRTGDSEFLFFLNPDTICSPRSVELLAAYMKENAGVAAAGPRQGADDTSVSISAFRFPTLLRPTINNAVTRLIFKDRMALHYPRGHPSITDGGEVDWLSGAALMVRRSAFDDVGGFDQRYFMYFEDTDLCDRLRKKGWRVEYRPESEIIHQGARSSGDTGERLRIEIQRSRLLYLSERHGRPGRWILRSLIITAAAVRAILWLFRLKPERMRTEFEIVRMVLTG